MLISESRHVEHQQILKNRIFKGKKFALQNFRLSLRQKKVI